MCAMAALWAIYLVGSLPAYNVAPTNREHRGHTRIVCLNGAGQLDFMTDAYGI